MYVDERSVLNKWEEAALDRILDWLGEVATPVLDVGCGVGHFGRVAAARGASLDLVGFDLMIELMADARVGYRALVQGDIHRLPLRDASVSAMVLSNTLHHISDRTVALDELRRVLAPGAVVIGYDPRRVAPIEAVKGLVRRGHEAFTDHHYAFAPREYRTLLEDAGLEIERYVAVDPVGPLLATALDMLRAGTLVDRDRLAAALVAVDRTIERRDRRGDIGLMLLARGRRSQ